MYADGTRPAAVTRFASRVFRFSFTSSEAGRGFLRSGATRTIDGNFTPLGARKEGRSLWEEADPPQTIVAILG